MFRKTGDSQSPTHSRPAEYASRKVIQARPDHPNRVVSPPRGLPFNMQQVAPAPDRPICHQVQQQVSSVCVTSTGSPSLSTQPAMGRYGCIFLSTGSHLGQSGDEAEGLPMQENHSDCTRAAQHALVLGPSGHVKPDLSVPANRLTQLFNQILHRNLSNLNLHAWLLEPQLSRNRASLRQWQNELRLLKEDQPDQTVRLSGPFLQSGASVIRWTSGLTL